VADGKYELVTLFTNSCPPKQLRNGEMRVAISKLSYHCRLAGMDGVFGQRRPRRWEYTKFSNIAGRIAGIGQGALRVRRAGGTRAM